MIVYRTFVVCDGCGLRDAAAFGATEFILINDEKKRVF